MEFDGIDRDFYKTCLSQLKERPDYTDAYLPILERYVFVTMKVARLAEQISDEEVTVEHTNKADHTNQATSPKWRMFLALDIQAGNLAKQLRLNPISAPPTAGKKKKKTGFDLTGKMKVA